MLSFLYGPSLKSIHDYWKNLALTRGPLLAKVGFINYWNLFFTVLVAGSPGSEHQSSWVLVKALFLVHNWHLLTVCWLGGRPRVSVCIFGKGLNPILANVKQQVRGAKEPVDLFPVLSVLRTHHQDWERGPVGFYSPSGPFQALSVGHCAHLGLLSYRQC